MFLQKNIYKTITQSGKFLKKIKISKKADRSFTYKIPQHVQNRL